MRMRTCAPAIVILLITTPLLAAAEPRFEAQTLDDDVAIGYGLVIGDVNGDDRPDILLADKSRFVWYRNPDWTRFVMAENLTERDNVCIAARDLDGDGRVEVAVGAQWNPRETSDPQASGALFYLIRPEDPTQRWETVRITPHEPTTHRIRWMRIGPADHRLVVLPLHGRGNVRGEGEGVRILAYTVPDDPRGTWSTELIDDSMHMTHNMDVVGDRPDRPEWVMVAGREGVLSATMREGRWVTRLHTHEQMRQGAGEVRAGRTTAEADWEGLYATIEPMHGNMVVAYAAHREQPEGDDRQEQWSVRRHVLDDTLAEGHGLWCADLLGLGRDQVVAGWRRPNADGKVGIKLYTPLDAAGDRWQTHWIDDDKMACEYLQVGDLDGDGRPEIVAAGRDSHNLIIYWNKSQ